VNTQYLFNPVLTRIQNGKHMYYESLVPSESFQFLQQFLLRRVSGKSSLGHKYRSVIVILPSPCGPRQSIQIRAKFFITALRPVVYFRVLPKHDDLSPTHAEVLFGICMQGALNAVRGRKNDVNASSVRFHEDVLDLDKSLEDGADVDLDGVW
jgi:hypothetical protein